MKRIFNGLIFSLLFLLTLQSCSNEDSYYDLTDEAKEFILYEVGDTFDLKNIETNEIITMTINQKEFEYIKDGGTPGSIYGGIGGDDYYERGEYSFSDDTNCYDGTISVEARSNNNFELTAYIGECFGNAFSSFEYEGKPLVNIEVNGINYTNVYLIKSYSQTIYYSQENGIIKIADNFSQETQFIISE